ncbi:hypothetical protein PtB15_17B324 [Puccinia triticina]|nr:hypothetical protein PtB15_17B324 [Puccinia triticina]
MLLAKQLACTLDQLFWLKPDLSFLFNHLDLPVRITLSSYIGSIILAEAQPVFTLQLR